VHSVLTSHNKPTQVKGGMTSPGSRRRVAPEVETQAKDAQFPRKQPPPPTHPLPLQPTRMAPPASTLPLPGVSRANGQL
jgi:hypothetical protein